MLDFDTGTLAPSDRAAIRAALDAADRDAAWSAERSADRQHRAAEEVAIAEWTAESYAAIFDQLTADLSAADALYFAEATR